MHANIKVVDKATQKTRLSQVALSGTNELLPVLSICHCECILSRLNPANNCSVWKE